MEKAEVKDQFLELDVNLCRPGPYQPRKHFDSEKMAELANSIQADGLIQPISVRRAADVDGTVYEIIAGERRWRAFKLLGKKQIPAFLKESDDKKTAIASVVENVQRENLSPLEEARAYRIMMDRLKMTQQEVSEKVGKSRSVIANSVRLLNLHADVLDYLETGLVTAGQVLPLLILKKDQQAKAAGEILKKGLNVKQAQKLVEKIVRQMEEGVELDHDGEEKKIELPDASQYDDMMEQFQKQLPDGITVSLKIKKDGSGRYTFDVPEEMIESFADMFTN